MRCEQEGCGEVANFKVMFPQDTSVIGVVICSTSCLCKRHASCYKCEPIIGIRWIPPQYSRRMLSA